jgi:L-serine dehydratase
LKNVDLLKGGDFYAGHQPFVKLKNTVGFDKAMVEALLSINGVLSIRVLDPVLPVLGVDANMPFTNATEMLAYNESHDYALWELGLKYEAARSGFSEEKLHKMMHNLVSIMKEAVEKGIEGTEYHDRILPSQAPGFEKKKKEGSLFNSPLNNEIILAVTAVMEIKSSMGIIIAAPTAGSCGTLPGALIGTAKFMKYDNDQIVQALFAAGMIGVLIAKGATFAAEEAGCMAETGSAASMAAAGLVTFANGSLKQTIAAASLALQNSFGLICDPVGNRVEAPCLGKNVTAASNALSSTNMALANYQDLIPFDEVVESMRKVGEAMPHEHCCTGLGGLAMTPTAKKIEAELENRRVKVGC